MAHPSPPRHHEAPARKISEARLRIPDAKGTHDEEIPIKACLPPKDLYAHIIEAGVVKAQWRWDQQIVMGLIAGFYIGFSYTGMMIVGGQIPEIQHGPNPGLYNLILGCFGFPLGLFMICVVGADLFTSDCSYMVVAFWEKRVRAYDVLRSWIMSWFVNLVGCILMALIVYWALIFDGRSDFVLYLTNKKTSAPFGACLCKGILANWLVNLAVWIANSAQDVTGKAVGIFLPITAFIAMGGEHCIANQFLFALCKFLGYPVSVHTMIVKNLIPSTIGNLIGGAFFVGTLYSLAVGTLFDSTYAAGAQALKQCGCGPLLKLSLPPLLPSAAKGTFTSTAAEARSKQAPSHSYNVFQRFIPANNSAAAADPVGAVLSKGAAGQADLEAAQVVSEPEGAPHITIATSPQSKW